MARVLVLLLLCWAQAAVAQVSDGTAVAGPAQEAWETLAQRAEDAAESGLTSDFALNRLRDELFDWRDGYLDALELNAGRVATIDAQLAALGAAPESSEEQPTIAARRAALEEERARLRLPAILAAEAHARADGLIKEIDAQIREREAERLGQRGASPLNPAQWGAGLQAITAGIGRLVTDTTSRLAAERTSGSLTRNLPLALVYFVVAGLLLTRGRRFAIDMLDRMEHSQARWRAIWAFLLSLGQIALPTVGLIALLLGIAQFKLLDLPGANLIEVTFSAGMTVIFARWLNAQLFPLGPMSGPLRYNEETRVAIRRMGTSLGWGLAAFFLLSAIVALGDPTPVAAVVAVGPLKLILAIFLFRLGRKLQTPPLDADSPTSSGGRVRKAIGQLVVFVSIATPVLDSMGYAAAADALFLPAILTLAILGVVIILQRLVYDIYAPADDTAEEEDAGPLMPVLIGFALFVGSLPFLALVWGARPADLLEIWTRFREGIALGETRISPTDLLTFFIVFAIGYILTRFIQGTLRKSVLPRTRLDLGGQNAIVAGFGYVGIFVAAVVAITSAGIDLSNLAIVAGALSVGIGFGLQNIVQNFVSGIILLIERPIGEGDMIEVNGQMGYVKDISVRSTRIETFDRTDVIIPNADLVSGQVTNWTRGNAVGRLILPVGVAYGSDVEKVREILADVAESHPMSLLDPPPMVFFMGFGASSLDFEIRVHLRDVAWKIVTLSEMNFQINERFADAGIEIPFPQRDLWLRNPETLTPNEKPDT